VCDIGASGAFVWNGVPAGNLWFAVVGDNNATYEGTWGRITAGERGGSTPSGRCGVTARNNFSTCP
jgi:hypothetical protein